MTRPASPTRAPVLFGDLLAAATARIGAPVAVGLDPHLDRLPGALGERARTGDRDAVAAAVDTFCTAALDALEGTVAAVKPQSAFFEQLGAPGVAALERVCKGARARGLLVILDAKRGDISSTAAAYARAALAPDGPMAADALTVSPWLGFDTLQPYLPHCRQHGRGLFVLVRTTNPGSAALQRQGSPSGAQRVAAEIARLNRDGLCGDSGLGSIGAVVGAQAADEAAQLRDHMPAAWFLVPGLGSQGGAPAQALAGRRDDGLGALPVASRSVLFGEDRPGETVADGIHRRAQALVQAVRNAG